MWFRAIIRWSPLVNAVVVVFVPILLVCISNALLILTIKKRYGRSVILVRPKGQLRDYRQVPLLKETSEQASQQKTEQRVARTVILIVTSFTITQVNILSKSEKTSRRERIPEPQRIKIIQNLLRVHRQYSTSLLYSSQSPFRWFAFFLLFFVYGSRYSFVVDVINKGGIPISVESE